MKKVAPPLLESVPGTRESARSKVLAALRQSGALARVEIASRAGMSQAAVSTVTADLLGEGVLVETAEAERDGLTRGRPRVRLDFSPAVACVAGLWVGLDSIELALADARGDRVAGRRERLPLRALGAEALTAVLAERVLRFCREEARGRTVQGLGIAFQGFVDVAAGRVIWSPVLSTADVPVAADLAARTGLPVDIDNDASAIAYALAGRQPMLRQGRVACLMMGDGVGLGLLMNGQIYRGARSGGSEFGHVRLGPEGPQCRCGARGCVEAHLADYALYRDAQAISDLPPLAGRHLPSEADMLALVARARAGDRAIVRLLERAGRMLAISAGLLIHLLEPDILVICGPGLRAKAFIEPAFHKEIAEATIPELRRLTRIELMEDDPRLLTEGAVRRALERVDLALAEREAFARTGLTADA